jgi:hypothetical protein
MDREMSADPYRDGPPQPGLRPIRLTASEFEQVREVVAQAGARLDDFFAVSLEFADRTDPSSRPTRVILTPRA